VRISVDKVNLCKLIRIRYYCFSSRIESSRKRTYRRRDCVYFKRGRKRGSKQLDCTYCLKPGAYCTNPQAKSDALSAKNAAELESKLEDKLELI